MREENVQHIALNKKGNAKTAIISKYSGKKISFIRTLLNSIGNEAMGQCQKRLHNPSKPFCRIKKRDKGTPYATGIRWHHCAMAGN